MTKLSNAILSMLLWCWGGTMYFLLEVVYKTATSQQEKISWTMLVLAIFLSSIVERCGYELPWDIPLIVQSFCCAILVTIAEFFSGCIINIWLQMNVWDYSHLWGNILGQICPQFFFVWFILCFLFITIFDWIRYLLKGGEKPHYKIL